MGTVTVPSYCQQQLENEMNRLMEATLAPSTTTQYNSAYDKFKKFCAELQFCVNLIQEHTLMLYVTNLSLSQSHSSIKIHLAAIRHHSILQGTVSHGMYLLIKNYISYYVPSNEHKVSHSKNRLGNQSHQNFY